MLKSTKLNFFKKKTLNDNVASKSYLKIESFQDSFQNKKQSLVSCQKVQFYGFTEKNRYKSRGFKDMQIREANGFLQFQLFSMSKKEYLKYHIQTKVIQGDQAVQELPVLQRVGNNKKLFFLSEIVVVVQVKVIINIGMIDIQYYQGAAITLIIINIISFLALIFVITTYLIRWKKIASFPMRLSFYLCISCMVQNLYVLIYPPVEVHQAQIHGQTATGFCVFESMLKTASDLSSIIWTLIIIYSSYATVVHGYTLERLQLFYLSVGYLLPIILALIPIFLDLYGYNNYFCWFNASTSAEQFGLKMGYFYGPLWIFFILEVYWAHQTFRKLKAVGLQGRELNIFKKILLFPIILLITGFFGTADMIYQFVTDQYSEWLDIVSIILLSLYGIFISMAYGFNPLIRDQVLIIFNKKDEQQAIRQSFTSSESSRKTERIAQLITM